MKRRHQLAFESSNQLQLNFDRDSISHETDKSERRKVRKVIVERKRRERIDRCLDQLKHFLIDSTKTTDSHQLQVLQGDLAGGTNMEKADILEFTVDYLRLLRAQNDQNRAYGYRRCAHEVQDFVQKSCLDEDVGRRLATFLAVRQTQAVQPDQTNRTAIGRSTFEGGSNRNDQILTSQGGSQENYLHLNMCFGFESTGDSRQNARYETLQRNALNSSPVNHVQSAEVDTTIKDERRTINGDDDEAVSQSLETDEEENESIWRPEIPNDGNSIRTLPTIEFRTNAHSYANDTKVISSTECGRTSNTKQSQLFSSVEENSTEPIWRPW